MKQDLVQAFNRHFRVETHDSPYLRDACYSLRYQVYCLETGYEDAAAFPDGRETDRFDGRAAHALVYHRPTGQAAATVRLVLPDPGDSSRPFPIELHCAASLQAAAFDMAGLPRDRVAEISRFAVSKSFKRRAGEAGTLAGAALGGSASRPSVDARAFPHLTLGLFQAIVAMSAEHGITHWYAVMEPSLLRLLTRFGIVFRPIGELSDYHGLRQPCMGVVDEVLEGIWRKRRDVWTLITENGRTWPAPEMPFPSLHVASP
ncbi:PEP-CTERM/exosortase system-associated acyltransferase [Thiohalobacter sp. IOR34]|uniref:PEP-CTERM/exosortase system-associated acyltransferase n=1 Tax=Thiohalobacter sp. IOR34 TaxID=3057176 RepID=UPI0025B167D4|nr:PEP-CTERM/exosortase system-associated acyltransferase [Thiohalobacter sp. IOR34]WJW74468.1 PEP-CTERM/exosortase system-associated acyltransferase [Thiohalobacter sp. IOR34]